MNSALGVPLCFVQKEHHAQSHFPQLVDPNLQPLFIILEGNLVALRWNLFLRTIFWQDALSGRGAKLCQNSWQVRVLRALEMQRYLQHLK